MNINLAYLVQSWAIFEQYARYKKGFWQETIIEGTTDIRVKVEECGFTRKFKNREDSLLTQITELCKNQCFIKVTENIPDQDFFL